jgi:hypothetical protein
MTIFTAWQLILTLGRESPYVNLEVGGRPFPAYLSRLVMAEIGVGKAGVEVIACLGWLAGLNILYKSVKIPGPAPLIFTPAFANRLQGKIRKDFGIGFDLVLNMAEAPRLFTTLELVEMMNPLAEDAEGTQGTED